MVVFKRLLLTGIPIIVVIFYGIIRFTTITRLPIAHQKTLNATIVYDEKFRIVENGILTSTIYETDFRRIQRNVCPNFGQDLHLLVVVMTKPFHRTRRMAIRKTWGHYALRSDISISFLFGSKSEQITHEMNIYTDMIIEGNEDTEINKTLKSISMMEFVATRCPKAKYVLKTHDDVFVNIPSVLNVIHKLNSTDRTMYGELKSNVTSPSHANSVMYISKRQYNGSVLPDFLTGDAYLFPGHIANEVYAESLNHIYTPVEHVFITGIVANSLGIKRVNISEFNTEHEKKTSSLVSIKADVSSRQYKYWTKFNINNPHHAEKIK